MHEHQFGMPPSYLGGFEGQNRRQAQRDGVNEAFGFSTGMSRMVEQLEREGQ